MRLDKLMNGYFPGAKRADLEQIPDVEVAVAEELRSGRHKKLRGLACSGLSCFIQVEVVGRPVRLTTPVTQRPWAW